MRITKKTLAQGSVSTDKEINVKAGWKEGTKITFEKEGDEQQGVIPADIVFTICQKPHDRFIREGDDLVHKCSVSLADALSGVRKSVLSIDGHKQIPIEAPHVTPDTEVIVNGEGMINSKTKVRGKLRVRFTILFPDLTTTERQQLVAIIGRK